MRLSAAEDCVSDLKLDEWSSDELDAAASARVETHVAACPRCRARHAKLNRERTEFYASAPNFETHARLFVPQRKSPPRPRRVRQFALIGAAAVAAVAGLVLLPESVGTRLKGGPSIGYFVKRADRVRKGDAATVLHAGDLVRFTYSTEQARHFAMFNRDARSTTIYYPSNDSSIRVEAGTRVPLEFSVELDDAPGPEHVYGLFCEESFELQPLRAALASTGGLPVPKSCELDTLTLRKEPVR
jgi:hypothetical protein